MVWVRGFRCLISLLMGLRRWGLRHRAVSPNRMMVARGSGRVVAKIRDQKRGGHDQDQQHRQE